MEKTTQESAALSINRELQRSMVQIGDGTSGLRYLQQAKALIAQPVQWMQNAQQAEENGMCRYSLFGAMLAVNDHSPQFQAAMRSLQSVVGKDVQCWNDRFWRSHRTVLKALDRAMSIAWHT